MCRKSSGGEAFVDIANVDEILTGKPPKRARRVGFSDQTAKLNISYYTPLPAAGGATAFPRKFVLRPAAHAQQITQRCAAVLNLVSMTPVIDTGGQQVYELKAEDASWIEQRLEKERAGGTLA